MLVISHCTTAQGTKNIYEPMFTECKGFALLVICSVHLAIVLGHWVQHVCRACKQFHILVSRICSTPSVLLKVSVLTFIFLVWQFVLFNFFTSLCYLKLVDGFLVQVFISSSVLFSNKDIIMGFFVKKVS
jgi:hypothetical protein